MGNAEHVKDIANTLDNIHDGQYAYCPHCGMIHEWDDVKHDDDDNTDYCPECGEEVYTMSMMDYFNGDDIYNIEYRAPSKHDDITSVSVMVACGGPNIYIDTADCKVKLYWWGDYAEYEFNRSTGDEITAWFNELWNCE